MKTMASDIFKHYESPEQYAEAFQQMIDAREKWRKQIQEQERSGGQVIDIIWKSKTCPSDSLKYNQINRKIAMSQSVLTPVWHDNRQ